MSSSLCQGFQSCLEQGVMEPRVLTLKLAPPGSNISPSLDQEKPIIIINNECDKNDTNSSWSFLQNLTKTENGNNKVYVHPTVKRSASMLSEKSLEMCTESLGSETGSNAGESSDDLSLLSCDTRNNVTNNNNNRGSNMNNCVSRRVNRASNFPPPLTSITDFGGVHVRPHREGGRLILEAMASPSVSPYFHAERCDGRLRLSLVETVYDYDGDDEDYEEEEDDEVEDQEDQEGKEGGSEKEHEVCDEEECVEKVEDEMGVTKFGRPRRCKESGNRDFFGDGYFEISTTISLCL
ncbi:protein FANTASTIC FOUR 1-like [Vicia villosa]|uniref:protein FANTASTIC FOUR 1-like n=1 Tax=Vicia villosa TaxID=3911 RepID=UPI00273C4311|nr:protein FANTASTIC FOUR 1-like [Vicia villosa]